MSGLQKLSLTVALCLLLLATLLPGSEAWRGGSFSRGWSRNSIQSHKPVHSQDFSAGSVARAAAAGAIGGAVVGSSRGHTGFNKNSSRKKGKGGGDSGSSNIPNPTYKPKGSGDREYYTGASSGPIYNSIIVVIGSMVSLLMGHWVAVM